MESEGFALLLPGASPPGGGGVVVPPVALASAVIWPEIPNLGYEGRKDFSDPAK